MWMAKSHPVGNKENNRKKIGNKENNRKPTGNKK
jgi:hypothetical protein